MSSVAAASRSPARSAAASARLVALVAGALLAGCATTPPGPPSAPGSTADWQRHAATLQRIDRFTMSGRVASSELGLRADLRWQQNPDGSFDLHLAGPFGAGAVDLRGDETGVEVRNSEGAQYTRDPEGWIRARYGWTLPVRGLRYWALGLPIPSPSVPAGSTPETAAALTLDAQGRLATLDQAGWRLTYTEYREQDGYDLPRRFDADNGRVRLKLLTDRWEDLPGGAP